MNKTIEIPTYKDIKTLEEFREYQRAVAKRWYQKNKEKKKAYQLERYYKKISELKANQ